MVTIRCAVLLYNEATHTSWCSQRHNTVFVRPNKFYCIVCIAHDGFCNDAITRLAVDGSPRHYVRPSVFKRPIRVHVDNIAVRREWGVWQREALILVDALCSSPL